MKEKILLMNAHIENLSRETETIKNIYTSFNNIYYIYVCDLVYKHIFCMIYFKELAYTTVGVGKFKIWS